MISEKTMTKRLFLLCFLLLMTACSVLDRSAPAQQSDAEEIAPAAQAERSTPEQVLADFMAAWSARDYPVMYALLSPQSQELYPRTVFDNRYDTTHNAMSFNGVVYTLNEVTYQGTTAVLKYDATLDSVVFGPIEDQGRIMRMVQTLQGWRLAWSTQDILNGLASGARLQQETVYPPRGSIYDRDGSPLVEENGLIVSLYLIQQDIPNFDNCMDLLAGILRRQRAGLVSQLSNYAQDTYFHIADIDPETYFANRIDLQNTCGIFESGPPFAKVIQYQDRAYFSHGAATHITGWEGRIPAEELNLWQAQGYQESDIVGLAGIERFYQETLAGKPRRFLRIFEPGGSILRELQSAEGAPSDSVTLTIDRDLQVSVAQSLSDAFNYASNNWSAIASGAAAVVMDVNTGEILAMASYPTFDPSGFNPETAYDASVFFQRITADPRRPFINKALAEQYAPGSTYKIITAVAAADTRVWPMDDTFFCDLVWSNPEDVRPQRTDWRAVDGYDAAGDVTLSQALTASCNPFFWEMGVLLFKRDSNLLVNYSQQLGLGAQTGLNAALGQEASGNLAPPSTVGEAVNNAVGQGNIQVTAVQMAMATAAIANGGTVYRPSIVKQVGSGPVEEPVVLRRLNLQPDVLPAVQEGMCAVTIDENLGTAYLIFGDLAAYTACGKTGTAQAGTAPNAWFVAYAPADQPQIAVVVVVPNSREGSQVAAPIARRIMDYYFAAPQAAFPDWWEDEYDPLVVPDGTVPGG